MAVERLGGLEQAEKLISLMQIRQKIVRQLLAENLNFEFIHC
ncbi:hypothetical protein N1I86_01200 [Bacillus sp. FSL W8-0116]